MRDFIRKQIKHHHKMSPSKAALMPFYRNPDGSSMAEFHDDFMVIRSLQRMLRRFINKGLIDYSILRNRYITIRNCFRMDGIMFIAVEYFSENTDLLASFASLVYYFDNRQILNVMNQELLDFLELGGKILNTDRR